MQISIFSDENADRRQLGIAVLAETLIKANTKVASCIEYVLAWDMPIVQFGSGERKYKSMKSLCFFRRYTRFFGDHGCASPAICAYSLAKYR
ncbi:unnamed protein product, partial [Onchocerca flexuosa]|uniref:Glyco_hydr_116N domain-containing protein n=1 Tax=Onchocerca flexuosa TaxID=387005 RepID=A0A183I337_9BILA